MRKLKIALIFLLLNSVFIFSQTQQIGIRQMTWGPDYQVYLQMDNDSSYRYEIDKLFHANPDVAFTNQTEFVYYPVNFEPSYIDSLLSLTSESEEFTAQKPQNPQIRKVTLWGAIGPAIGGGWVHFINCLVYSLETSQLDLTSPLLTRPASTWKPKPMTETFKRTRKWKYYSPVEQKYARKEYKARLKKNQLGDLQSIPQEYINLMLTTSDKEYKLLQKNKDRKKIAKIDLVKLMLGAPYMSEPQIEYVKSRVLTAISSYNKQHMPSVLIFDKYQAAVAMTLDGLGYKAQKIVFRDQGSLTPQEIMQRTYIIRGVVALINEANNKALKERLNGLYAK